MVKTKLTALIEEENGIFSDGKNTVEVVRLTGPIFIQRSVFSDRPNVINENAPRRANAYTLTSRRQCPPDFLYTLTFYRIIK